MVLDGKTLLFRQPRRFVEGLYNPLLAVVGNRFSHLIMHETRAMWARILNEALAAAGFAARADHRSLLNQGGGLLPKRYLPRAEYIALASEAELGVEDAPDVAAGLQSERSTGSLVLETKKPVVDFLLGNFGGESIGKRPDKPRPHHPMLLQRSGLAARPPIAFLVSWYSSPSRSNMTDRLACLSRSMYSSTASVMLASGWAASLSKQACASIFCASDNPCALSE